MTWQPNGTIAVTDFRTALSLAFREILHLSQLNVLDPDESLTETLATITAEEASTSVGANNSTIAAQVDHLVFLMDERLNFNPNATLDWSVSWTRTSVSDEEWDELRAAISDRGERISGFVATFEGWDANYLAGALSLLAHCSYHLGQIREALGVIRSA